jgi:hypothetical protein
MWLFPKPKITVVVLNRDPLKLRLNEFRSNKSLVGEAQKMMLTGSIRLMLDVLRNEHPCMMVLPIGASPTDRIAAQCRAEGYTMALANFEAMADFQEMKSMPEPTFEPEEKY